MDKLLSRKNLLLILVLLLSVKYALLPLLTWQSAEAAALAAKTVQLAKLKRVVSSSSLYAQQVSAVKEVISKAEQKFYPDDGNTKLVIQQYLERVFGEHSLTITRFSWVFDTPGDVRVMRAKVRFSGSVENMIKTFWDLDRGQKFMRMVESNQQMKPKGADFGETSGDVTLDFYALKKDYSDIETSAGSQGT